MKTTLPNLQILRFIAAAMVLLSHVQHEASQMNFLDQSHYSPWTAIYLAGGVDIFFIISGFIMYTVASKDFGVSGMPVRFFLRRLSRIMPPYWLFTTAMIGAAIAFSGHVKHSALSLDHILASYFFFPYENAYGKPYPMLMLGWTLNYEFFFYAVFGCTLFFRKALGLSLIFLVIGGLAGLGIFDTFKALPLSFWSNPIVLEFLFGIALAMLRERGLRCSFLVGGALVSAGFLAMAILMAEGIAGHFWVVRFLWMGLPALCICAGAVLVRQNEALGRFKRFLVFLGDTSYALYLSHPFALNLVALLWIRTGLQQPQLYVAISCVLSIAVACLTHLLIEKPMTFYFDAWVNKFLKSRSSAAPQTV